MPVKTSAVKVLNSGVAIYLSWLSFFSISVILCHSLFFLIKLLTLRILFSTAVNVVFVAKLLTSGILFSNSMS